MREAVKGRRRRQAATCVLQLIALLLFSSGCTQHAEPRWLVRALPGAYPEVVYFVPTRQQAVALTIDDGLDPETTPLILDALKTHGAHATFFLLSNSLPEQQGLVSRILEEGHEIGHHMTQDEVTVSLSDEDLTEKFNKAADALETLAPVAWFRPGSGRYDDRVLTLARSRGYRIALASVAPLDTIISNPARMSAFIAWMVEPGSVMVLHDALNRGYRTTETLEHLLPVLEDRGYQVLTLTELDRLAEQRNRSGQAAAVPQHPPEGAAPVQSSQVEPVGFQTPSKDT